MRFRLLAQAEAEIEVARGHLYGQVLDLDNGCNITQT